MILVLIAWFFCSYIFAQVNRDSLQLMVDSLTQSMISEIKGFEDSNADFLVLCVNDTESDWHNSYHCIHNVDSCSISYMRMIIIDLTDEQLQTYELRFANISMNRRVPRGKSSCYNELTEIEKCLKKEYLTKSTKQEPIDWKAYSYVLYGKVKGNYIFETFGPEFLATFHSGMVYEIVCNKFGIHCPK
jgi:hypothetical protein